MIPIVSPNDVLSFVMNKYELLLVLPGTLDEGETTAKTEEAVAVIKEFGTEAELIAMGKNRLAYPIKQVRYGYFYTVTFVCDKEAIKKIEEKLRLTRGLLRAIITHYNEALDTAENAPRLTGMIEHVEEVEEPVQNVNIPVEEETVVVNETEKEPEVAVVAEPVAAVEEPVTEEKKKPAKIAVLDLKEIDKKLDEILADDNIDI